MLVKKNHLLYCILLMFLNVQADDVYTNFLFFNKSKIYTVKVVSGRHQCIDPDRYHLGKTTILPNDPPSSYWTNSIKHSCAAGSGLFTRPKDPFVTWNLSVYNGNKKLCSAGLIFYLVTTRRPKTNKLGWVTIDKQVSYGETPLCRSLKIDDPYRIKGLGMLGKRNKITITINKY